MKQVIAVVLGIMTSAGVVFAADTDFEQRKSDVLKRIDERIAHIQAERSCVQSATTKAALKACQETFRAEVKQDKANRKAQK